MCGGTDTCIGVWELALSYAATFFTCGYYIILSWESQGKIEQMFFVLFATANSVPAMYLLLQTQDRLQIRSASNQKETQKFEMISPTPYG